MKMVLLDVSEEIKEDFVDMLKPSEATTDEEKRLEEVINAKQNVVTNLEENAKEKIKDEGSSCTQN